MAKRKGWCDEPLGDYAYRPVHHDRQSLTTEQDIASSYRRTVQLEDGATATGRVKLTRKARARRVYATLIWDHHGRHELPLGEVTLTSRASNLSHAWILIHQHDLLTPRGRAAWTALPPTERPPVAPHQDS